MQRRRFSSLSLPLLLPKKMREDIKELIEEIQASMVDSAQSCFIEAELDDLRCLIRVTGEFLNYLQVANTNTQPRSKGDGPGVKVPLLQSLTARIKPPTEPIDEVVYGDFDLRYTIETVFSGVDSFSSVSAAYRALAGPIGSTINWDKVSVSTFNEQFTSKFHEFVTELNFEKQCRLLLDLFKLAIVFAGFSYD
jgi:hypothetical protein